MNQIRYILNSQKYLNINFICNSNIQAYKQLMKAVLILSLIALTISAQSTCLQTSLSDQYLGYYPYALWFDSSSYLNMWSYASNQTQLTINPDNSLNFFQTISTSAPPQKAFPAVYNVFKPGMSVQVNVGIQIVTRGTKVAKLNGTGTTYPNYQAQFVWVSSNISMIVSGNAAWGNQLYYHTYSLSTGWKSQGWYTSPAGIAILSNDPSRRSIALPGYPYALLFNNNTGYYTYSNVNIAVLSSDRTKILGISSTTVNSLAIYTYNSTNDYYVLNQTIAQNASVLFYGAKWVNTNMFVTYSNVSVDAYSFSSGSFSLANSTIIGNGLSATALYQNNYNLYVGLGTPTNSNNTQVAQIAGFTCCTQDGSGLTWNCNCELNCAICNGTYNCTTCALGFYADNNGDCCNIQYCASCSLDPTTCEQCQTGYQLDPIQTICVSSTSHLRSNKAHAAANQTTQAKPKRTIHKRKQGWGVFNGSKKVGGKSQHNKTPRHKGNHTKKQTA